jgi:hypothetical protein
MWWQKMQWYRKKCQNMIKNGGGAQTTVLRKGGGAEATRKAAGRGQRADRKDV